MTVNTFSVNSVTFNVFINVPVVYLHGNSKLEVGVDATYFWRTAKKIGVS